MDTKTCYSCQEEKPLSDFHKRADSKDGLHGKCGVCIREGHAKHRQTVKFLDAQMRHKYGISAEDYNRMFEEQGGLCAMCGKPEVVTTAKGVIKRLAVDHNHLTGKVRELLCQKCNVGLGHLETIEALAQAMAYLMKHEVVQTEAVIA